MAWTPSHTCSNRSPNWNRFPLTPGQIVPYSYYSTQEGQCGYFCYRGANIPYTNPGYSGMQSYGGGYYFGNPQPIHAPYQNVVYSCPGVNVLANYPGLIGPGQLIFRTPAIVASLGTGQLPTVAVHNPTMAPTQLVSQFPTPPYTPFHTQPLGPAHVGGQVGFTNPIYQTSSDASGARAQTRHRVRFVFPS